MQSRSNLEGYEPVYMLIKVEYFVNFSSEVSKYKSLMGLLEKVTSQNKRSLASPTKRKSQTQYKV
jgi:hypothetical protein